MTHKEIFAALLAGKALTYATSQIKPGERWIVLHGEHIRDQDFRLADGIIIGESHMKWQVYEEPNPHTKGTFAWAREEIRRGAKYVRCINGRYSARDFQPGNKLLLSTIDATDWEVLS